MSQEPRRRYNKRELLAIHDMERLGINPIEMLLEVYTLARDAYVSARGLSDKGDSGSAYLSVAGKAAADLASYKHPKLSALAIADMTNQDQEEKKQLTTVQAIDIIKKDPFAPQAIKEIDTARVVESMNSTIQTPFLPKGASDDDSRGN